MLRLFPFSCILLAVWLGTATRTTTVAKAATTPQPPRRSFPFAASFSSWRGEGGEGGGGGGGGGREGGDANSWLSAATLKLKKHTSGDGDAAWAAYRLRKSQLEQQPDNPQLHLDTAEALLRWMRHTTDGNFPRASTGKVSPGDNPSNRIIWRKHAPEALRLLKAGATHAESSGTYDLAKYRFMRAEATTYTSSAKGIVRAALQADAVVFKRRVKPLVNEHPKYQGGIGHIFLGMFFLVAPWPVHDLAKAQGHFDAALKIDSLSRRNHYCMALLALELGDTAKATTSFRQAVKCKATSPEEQDIADFFLRESKGALRALENSGKRKRQPVTSALTRDW